LALSDVDTKPADMLRPFRQTDPIFIAAIPMHVRAD
jgi:hypothetical protein